MTLQQALFDGIIVDNFAGGGGASTGIKMAIGRDVDIAINHDPAAIAMHMANHPYTQHFCESVWEIDPRKVVQGRPVSLCWFSPDCFPVGTLVLTSEGYRAIETIKVGDQVLTHKLRWQKVTEVSSTVKPLLEIRGHGHPGLKVSLEHPFYARQRRNVWNNDRRSYDRVLDPVDWVSASVMDRGWYWATPRLYPSLPIPKIEGRNLEIDEKLMWLAGRYVGDGWTRIGNGRAELVITCGKHEVDSLRSLLNRWPRSGNKAVDNELAWHERETATAYQFSTNHKGLVQWLRHNFGHRAESKGIPAWALGMSEGNRLALLNGYLSADGHKFDTFTEAHTVSKSLAFGIKALANSLGKTVAVYLQSNSSVIQGRKVNARPLYKARWREQVDTEHIQTEILDNIEWCPVREQKDAGETATVCNIGVEEDESYIAEGIIVHNCKHFSKAKGGKPVEKSIRGLAWAAVRWAATVRPRVIILENVEEFKTWGPLTREGYPDKKQQGRTFNCFVNALKKHGYAVDFRELRACDYGAPTIRKRFFLIARCDGQPIVWPEPTHSDPKSKSGLSPWRTAAEIIDWSLPCPSIFERKRPLAENTMKRIARGIEKFVINNPEPFIVQVNHSGEHFRGQRINEPLPTITAKHGYGLVAPFLAQYHSYDDSARGQELTRPLLTLDTSNRYALVSAFIDRQFGTSRGNAIDIPLGTVMPEGAGKSALVQAFLMAYYGTSVGSKVTEPLPTVVSKDRFGLVVVGGLNYQISDIGMRMLEPRELFNAQGFPADYIIDRDADGKSYPKSAQVARCGNAVPPPFAEALVRANLPDLCQRVAA